MLQKKLVLLQTVFVIMGITDVLNAQANRVSQAKLISTLPPSAVEISIFAYPSELFFGDTCYCQITKKNHEENPLWIRGSFKISGLGLYDGIKWIVSTEGIEECYIVVAEIDSHRDVDFMIAPIYLQPGESSSASYPLELPPLEAMEHPFWKKLREKMTPDGVKCTLSTELWGEYVCRIQGIGRRDEDIDQEERDREFRTLVVYTHEILIRPRPPKEQWLLDKWLQDTPKQFFPPVSEWPPITRRWSTPEMLTFEKVGYRQSGGHFVEINGQKYNPWRFIRDGNRKPPAQLCPTTPEGWHQLEESLVPSTMRDEIRFSRMLMDYYGAEGDVQIQKRKELIQWLKSLPEPQSMSMTSNLEDMSMMYGMDVDPTRAEALAKPYSELVDELRPMMSYYHQYDGRGHFDRLRDHMDRYRKTLEENQAE